jgi:hypothetical protein
LLAGTPAGERRAGVIIARQQNGLVPLARMLFTLRMNDLSQQRRAKSTP